MNSKFIVLTCLFLSLCYASLAQKRAFAGMFSNGMKGATCTFELSADGKSLTNFTFKGYWRCGGKLELMTMGPTKSVKVQNGKFDAVIVEPENGGATAFRFELHGQITGKKATGTFRGNLNALACDTYVLNWTATTK